jgi:hypothetical protein
MCNRARVDGLCFPGHRPGGCGQCQRYPEYSAQSAHSRASRQFEVLLFVGHEDAGDNMAGLYSLVATCEANSVNPIDYLRDVLLRISTHPADRIVSVRSWTT